MLPLLFFELLWKVMWVVGWGFPLWSSQQLAPDSQQTLIAALVGIVLVPLAIPWGYVFKQYVKAPGDPWGKQVTVEPSRAARYFTLAGDEQLPVVRST